MLLYSLTYMLSMILDKSQADSIQAELSLQLKNAGMKGSVQISTVDAFQVRKRQAILFRDLSISNWLPADLPILSLGIRKGRDYRVDR